MKKTKRGQNVVWLLTDENPWGSHGAAPVEDGKLPDGWEYQIKQQLLANSQPSGWFVATVSHVDPEHKPNPKNKDTEFTTFGLPLHVAFKTLEEARASACGFYNALRLFPGYPDVKGIVSDIRE